MSAPAFKKKSDARRGRFKKGLDPDDARRKREDVTVQIRKNKRDQQIEQRRRNLLASRNQRYGGNSSGDMENKVRNLPALVSGIKSQNWEQVVECVTNLRKLLSIEREPPIDEVIQAGVVPMLVNFLRASNNHALQFESAWALTNIASGTSAHTRVVIEEGATPLFVELLKSPNLDVAEQAVWALGNIAGDSPTCRDLVLSHGAMNHLLGLLQGSDQKLSMLRTATWTLSNFCRGKPQPSFQVVAQALPVLSGLIHYTDTEVITDACWALSYLSDDNETNNQKIQMVVQSKVCKKLCELLLHESPNVQTPALRTVGNIVTGDDAQTQAIINCGALQALGRLLDAPQKNIQKEACWTISNITAGIPQQIQAVLQANLIPHLLEILKRAHFDVQKEAAWAISNATSGGTADQIKYLVSQGCIPPLCNLFQCRDVRIITVAMEGIENILRVGEMEAGKNRGTNKFTQHLDECGGLDMLEALQQHKNEKIYSKAMRILQTYFEG